MRRFALGLSALVLALASRAEAGATLRWSEVNREKGNPVPSTVVAYSGAPGLRVEITESRADGPRQMTFLYLAASRTLYVRQGAEAWIATTPGLLAQAEAAVASVPAPKVTVTPTHTRHTVAGFACEGNQLRQPGRPSRYVCLADPSALGLDHLAQDHFRQLGRILTLLLRVPAAKSDPSLEKDDQIRFNTYDMSGGFPIREWESRKGEMWMDTQLTGITVGEPPDDLFQRPVLQGELSGGGPPQSPAP